MANLTARQTFLGAREARLYRSGHQDGLIDLFAGGIGILIGVAWAFDLVALGPLAPASLLPLWPLAKRRITEPRLGYAAPHPQRAAREKKKLAGFLVLGLLTLATGVGLYFLVRRDGMEGWGPWIAGLPCVLLALGAIVCALAFDLPRFVLYALGFMIAGAWVVHARIDPGWGLLAGGLLMLTGGLILVSRFVRRNPRHA